MSGPQRRHGAFERKICKYGSAFLLVRRRCRQRRIEGKDGAVHPLTQCSRQASPGKIREEINDLNSGACMTRTSPDGAGGDHKAHAWLGQNAPDYTVCRSVWPVSPTQPALCRACISTPTTAHGQASGSLFSVSLSHRAGGVQGFRRCRALMCHTAAVEVLLRPRLSTTGQRDASGKLASEKCMPTRYWRNCDRADDQTHAKCSRPCGVICRSTEWWKREQIAKQHAPPSKALGCSINPAL